MKDQKSSFRLSLKSCNHYFSFKQCVIIRNHKCHLQRRLDLYGIVEVYSSRVSRVEIFFRTPSKLECTVASSTFQNVYLGGNCSKRYTANLSLKFFDISSSPAHISPPRSVLVPKLLSVFLKSQKQLYIVTCLYQFNIS